jgi:hypothetical protein
MKEPWKNNGFCLLWRPANEPRWYYRTDSVLWPVTFGTRTAVFGSATGPLLVFPSVACALNVMRLDVEQKHPWLLWTLNYQGSLKDGSMAAVAQCRWLPWNQRLPRFQRKPVWQWLIRGRFSEHDLEPGTRDWRAAARRFQAKHFAGLEPLLFSFRLARAIIPEGICFTNEDAGLP